MTFHHIGLACRDITVALESIRRIYNVAHESQVIYDNNQSASLCLVTVNGGPMIELISGPQVEGLLQRGISYYHICYEVNHLDGEIKRLTAAGAILCGLPKPAPLFDNRPVAFLLSPTGMIELLESET